MHRDDSRLKCIASEIALPREFYKDGGSLNDFLRNRLIPTDTPQEVGAKILDYFCLDSNDRQYNNFMLGVRLAVGYLEGSVGGSDSATRARALKDLKSILSNRPSLEQLACWAKSHYP